MTFIERPTIELSGGGLVRNDGVENGSAVLQPIKLKLDWPAAGVRLPR
jgi:hypothetical protein